MKGTTITVVGNLITPVNRRNLGDGRSVANFRVACNERRIDRATGAWGDGDTFYIGVSCWRELAESVAATFGVGDPIIVRGRIYTNTYDGKDGRRTVQEIDADAVGPDLSRCRVSALTRIKRGTGPAVLLETVEAPDEPDADRDGPDQDEFHVHELDRSAWGREDAMQDPRFATPEEPTDRREALPVGGH